MTLIATAVPILSDNYAWLLRDDASGALAIVDPAQAAPVLAAIEHAIVAGGQLESVVLTHHHDDHIAAVGDVRRRFPNARVIGAAADAHRLPPLDQTVRDGDTIRVGGIGGRVIETPGHTIGHVSYYFAEGGVLICADTLFSLGCGKLMEGTAEDMLASLRKLAALPPDTLVCCGHEYTQANARFALSVDPDNAALRTRAAEVTTLRTKKQPTVPVRLRDELATNPFLRARDAEALGRLRRKKDDFR